MLCDECQKKPAEYHKILEINGHKTERHLCPACQQKFNDFALLKFSGLGSLFSTFTETPQPERKKHAVCKECGQNYGDFLRTGYLGCAACYREFRSALSPIIFKTQGAGLHTGKRPRPSAEDLKQQQILMLRKQLNAAVAEERFAEAQLIKNEIDKLIG